MITALFISEEYLRDFTPLSANIDMQMIFPHVASFQDAFIQDILGTTLYNNMQAVVIANNPTTLETTLLNLCRQALAWGTVAKMIPFVSIQIRNIGTVQTTTDNGSTATLEMMKYIRNEAQTQYEFYAKRLSDYLLFHGNLYPGYVQFDATQMAPRMKSPYNCGLYLGATEDQGIYGDFDLHTFWQRYVR